MSLFITSNVANIFFLNFAGKNYLKEDITCKGEASFIGEFIRVFLLIFNECFRTIHLGLNR